VKTKVEIQIIFHSRVRTPNDVLLNRIVAVADPVTVQINKEAMAESIPDDVQDGEISFYAKESNDGKRKLSPPKDEWRAKKPRDLADGQEEAEVPPPSPSPPTPTDGSSETNDSDKENVTPTGSPSRHVPLATDELGGFFGTGSPAVSEASTIVFDVPEVEAAEGNDSFLLGDLTGVSTSSPCLPSSPDVTYYYPQTSSSVDRPSPLFVQLVARNSNPPARRHLVFDDDQAVPFAMKKEE